MSDSIRELLAGDAAKLAAVLALDLHTARIEAQSLLQHALGKPRAWLLAHPEQVLDQPAAAYRTLLQRRLSGEPLAYILGEREFFGLTFKVTPATLIPRPETELLVELALQRVPPQGKYQVLDLGTGSGAIALSIAHARPDAEIWACDVSVDALAVARENVQRLRIGNVQLLESDWFDALPALRFDVIVSNPPYIAEGDRHLAEGDLRFEPVRALVGGQDGLRDIRHLITDSRRALARDAWLLFEHGYDQAERARDLLREGGYENVFSARDLAGIERVSGGQLRALS